MKRILISFSMIAVVAAVGVGATRAFFSDSVASTGNTFTAGTLSLSVDGTHSAGTGKFVLGNIKPGDDTTTNSTSSSTSYSIVNTGSINGFLNLVGDSVAVTPGSGPAHVSNGHSLGDLLTVTVKAGASTLYTGTLTGLASAAPLNVPLAAGASTTVKVDYSWVSSAFDNGAQGDSALVGLGFNLSQNTLP